MIALGHSDHLKIYVNHSKIYVDPGIEVHSNDIFSKSTAPMVLKFYMQHDKSFRMIKFWLVGNQKWLLLLKIAKPLKSTFSLESLDIFG